MILVTFLNHIFCLKKVDGDVISFPVYDLELTSTVRYSISVIVWTSQASMDVNDYDTL